jgi:membrane protein
MIAAMNFFFSLRERLRVGTALAFETLRTWPWFETLRTLRQRFREDRLGLSAGSLTFTTLIAIVPLLTVTLALFTAFPIFAKFQDSLQKYFLQSLVPDAIAKPVLGALTQFANKASRLGSAGLVILVVSALSLMLTIDRTLTGIWRVRSEASPSLPS